MKWMIFKNFTNCCKYTTKLVLVIVFPIILSLYSCSKGEEGKDQVFKKKRINPNAEEKAKEFRDKGGGLFNSARKGGSTTFEFSSSNPLWRATLETIDFMPLANVDYAGGIIITDWYSAKNGEKEIKLNIRFLSTELSATSVKVSGYIKDCAQLENKCITIASKEAFNNQIKLKILEKAREISIKDEAKKDKK